MEPEMYCLVKMLDEIDDVVTVISSTWLEPYKEHARFPKVPLRKWKTAVARHQDPGEDFERVPVKVIATSSEFRVILSSASLYGPCHKAGEGL